MRKIRKLCFVLSLLLVLSFFLASPAFAGTLINTTVILDFYDSGSLTVSWDVDGVAYDDVEMGRVTVYLQKYSTSWSTVKTVTTTDYNDYVFSNIRNNVAVSSSGTYRLKTVFYAEDGDIQDSKTKYSSSKSVN